MEKGNLNFFSRVKLAVTKLEDYNVFINEKLSIGLKYFLLIILILSIVLSIIQTYDFNQKMSAGQLQEEYNISDKDTDILFEQSESMGIVGFTAICFTAFLLGIFFIESISVIMDCIVLSIFAYCTAKITKTNLNYKQTFNISIYSLTLPIFLYMIYCIANYVFNFYTQYFKTIYLLIAYVYVVAVILIIKSDLMKQKAIIRKVEKIKTDEIEEEKNEEDNNDEKDDKNKEDDKKTDDENKKDDMVDGEPDGSEI